MNTFSRRTHVRYMYKNFIGEICIDFAYNSVIYVLYKKVKYFTKLNIFYVNSKSTNENQDAQLKRIITINFNSKSLV